MPRSCPEERSDNPTPRARVGPWVPEGTRRIASDIRDVIFLHQLGHRLLPSAGRPLRELGHAGDEEGQRRGDLPSAPRGLPAKPPLPMQGLG